MVRFDQNGRKWSKYAEINNWHHRERNVIIMALNQDDLQAIATLLQPINNRLDGIDNRLDRMDSRLNRVEHGIDKLNSEVAALKTRQIEIGKEIKDMNRKISGTYDLALDAWGKSTENREWIEHIN